MTLATPWTFDHSKYVCLWQEGPDSEALSAAWLRLTGGKFLWVKNKIDGIEKVSDRVRFLRIGVYAVRLIVGPAAREHLGPQAIYLDREEAARQAEYESSPARKTERHRWFAHARQFGEVYGATPDKIEKAMTTPREPVCGEAPGENEKHPGVPLLTIDAVAKWLQEWERAHPAVVAWTKAADDIRRRATEIMDRALEEVSAEGIDYAQLEARILAASLGVPREFLQGRDVYSGRAAYNKRDADTLLDYKTAPLSGACPEVAKFPCPHIDESHRMTNKKACRPPTWPAGWLEATVVHDSVLYFVPAADVPRVRALIEKGMELETSMSARIPPSRADLLKSTFSSDDIDDPSGYRTAEEIETADDPELPSIDLRRLAKHEIVYGNDLVRVNARRGRTCREIHVRAGTTDRYTGESVVKTGAPAGDRAVLREARACFGMYRRLDKGEKLQVGRDGYAIRDPWLWFAACLFHHQDQRPADFYDALETEPINIKTRGYLQAMTKVFVREHLGFRKQDEELHLALCGAKDGRGGPMFVDLTIERTRKLERDWTECRQVHAWLEPIAATEGEAVIDPDRFYRVLDGYQQLVPLLCANDPYVVHQLKLVELGKEPAGQGSCIPDAVNVTPDRTARVDDMYGSEFETL